jgi:hypothetical protein
MINGEQACLTTDICEYLGIPRHKLYSVTQKGLFPARDGYTAPDYGKKGIRGNFWYRKTVLAWEAMYGVDFQKRMNTVIVREIPSMVNCTFSDIEDATHSDDTKTLGGILGNLLATQLGLQDETGDETVKQSPDGGGNEG